MTHFLVIFDRATGRVLREESFEDRSKALEARFEAERLHRKSATIEIVVLSANSKEDLHRTHARYFRTVGELAQLGVDRAAAAQHAERQRTAEC